MKQRKEKTLGESVVPLSCDKGEETSSQEVPFLLLLGNTYYALRKYVNRELARAFQQSLSMDQAMVLLLLAHSEEHMLVQDLADALGREQAAMSRQLTRMEAQRWIVKKVPEKDSRKRVVQLTPQGERAVEGLKGLWRKTMQEAVLCHFSPIEYNELLRMLAVIHKGVTPLEESEPWIPPFSVFGE